MGNPPNANAKKLYAQLLVGHDPETKRVCRRCLTVKSIFAFSRRGSGVKNCCRKCAVTPVHKTPVDEKQCIRCGQVKPARLYHTKKDNPTGLQPACKACMKIYSKAHCEKLKARAPEEVPQIKERFCSSCQQTKPISAFFPSMSFLDGVRSGCRSCDAKLHDTVLSRARASHRAAMKAEGYRFTYTADDHRRSVAFRVAGNDDPCFYCHEKKPRMTWAHVDWSKPDVWDNLRRACSTCCNRRLRHTVACITNDPRKCSCGS